MVTSCALRGVTFNGNLATREAICSARGPETRTTLIAASPKAVEMAAMVSLSIGDGGGALQKFKKRSGKLQQKTSSTLKS